MRETNSKGVFSTFLVRTKIWDFTMFHFAVTLCRSTAGVCYWLASQLFPAHAYLRTHLAVLLAVQTTCCFGFWAVYIVFIGFLCFKVVLRANECTSQQIDWQNNLGKAQTENLKTWFFLHFGIIWKWRSDQNNCTPLIARHILGAICDYFFKCLAIWVM